MNNTVKKSGKYNAQARWITHPEIENQSAAPLFRKSFHVVGEVRSATLVLCGLGYHEAWINGQRIGDHVLDPAQTDYEKRVLYVVHDVLAQVRPGENALGVMLGNGWYNQNRVWATDGLSYGRPKLFAELHLVCEDGRSQIIASDTQWRAAFGPVVENNIYSGEVYDARLEILRWSDGGFDDSGWSLAVETESAGGVFEEQRMPPCRRIETLQPVSIVDGESEVYTVDFGQNFSGWVQIRLKAPAGTEISMRFAETLGGDGLINTDSCGGLHTKVEQIDRYICKGGGEEIWEPRFTYHGFRYVEITGWPGSPSSEQLSGVVVHTDLPTLGRFECSDERLNQLHRMALWTHRSNIHGIPEDCPVRERCGWLGDANVVAEFSMWNYDGKIFWEKYLDDIETSRELNGGLPCNIAPGKRTAGTANPDWAAAFILLPWYIYQYSGDPSVLSKHWNGMQELMAHFMNQSEGGCLPGGFGDWFDPGGDACCSHTPPELTTTLWFYRCAQVMNRIAELFGDPSAELYNDLISEIRQGFVRRFYDFSAGSFGSQTADVMALKFKIPDEAERPRVWASLLRDIEQRDTHFNVGIMGMRYLFEVLSEYGQGELALQLLHQNTFPSFGDLIQQGATTLWEYWGEPEHDVREGTRSLNHPMMGGYDNWFFNTLVGIRIDPESPGFERFVLAPAPIPSLQWVKAHYDCLHGRISSAWKLRDGIFEWAVTVPPGTSATVTLPFSKEIRILAPGSYHLSDSLQKD